MQTITEAEMKRRHMSRGQAPQSASLYGGFQTKGSLNKAVKLNNTAVVAIAAATTALPACLALQRAGDGLKRRTPPPPAE